jgi:hypothetical protein
VLVREAMFEAVRAVAFVAVHARDKRSVDQRLAIRIRALLLVGEDVWFCGQRGIALRSAVCGRALLRPFAGFGAFVGGFGAVVEAEFAGGRVLVGLGLWVEKMGRKRALPFAAFTSEG